MIWINYGVLLFNFEFKKLMNVTKLGWHLMLALSIPNIKVDLGLQRSGNLDPIYVGIWSAFAKCWPESPGLGMDLQKKEAKKIKHTVNLFRNNLQFIHVC